MQTIAIFKGGPIGGEIHAVRDEGRYHRVPVFLSPSFSAGVEPSPSGPAFTEHTYEWQGETERHPQTGEWMRVMRWQDPSESLRDQLRMAKADLLDERRRREAFERNIDIAVRLLDEPAFVSEAQAVLEGALD